MHNYTLPNLICGLRILYAFFLEGQFKRAILIGRYNLQLPAEQRSQWQGIPYNQLTGAHAHQLKIIFRIRKILETSFRTGYGACQLPPSPQNSADLNRQNLSFILRSTSSSNKPRTYLSPPLSTHTHTHLSVDLLTISQRERANPECFECARILHSFPIDTLKCQRHLFPLRIKAKAFMYINIVRTSYI